MTERDDAHTGRTPSRRAVVSGAAAGAGLIGATTVLAACGGGGETGAGSSAPPSAPAQTPSAPPSSAGAGQAGRLAAVSEVPVGGGKIIKDQQIVVTQPEEGTFKAFATVCTHKGCDVDEVKDGTVICPCHGSAFSASDGSVKKGPAEQPLSEIQVKVEGDGIMKA